MDDFLLSLYVVVGAMTMVALLAIIYYRMVDNGQSEEASLMVFPITIAVFFVSLAWPLLLVSFAILVTMSGIQYIKLIVESRGE